MPLLVALIAVALLALAGGLASLRERLPALQRIELCQRFPTRVSRSPGVASAIALILGAAFLAVAWGAAGGTELGRRRRRDPAGVASLAVSPPRSSGAGAGRSMAAPRVAIARSPAHRALGGLVGRARAHLRRGRAHARLPGRLRRRRRRRPARADRLAGLCCTASWAARSCRWPTRWSRASGRARSPRTSSRTASASRSATGTPSARSLRWRSPGDVARARALRRHAGARARLPRARRRDPDPALTQSRGARSRPAIGAIALVRLRAAAAAQPARALVARWSQAPSPPGRCRRTAFTGAAPAGDEGERSRASSACSCSDAGAACRRAGGVPAHAGRCRCGSAAASGRGRSGGLPAAARAVHVGRGQRPRLSGTVSDRVDELTSETADAPPRARDGLTAPPRRARYWREAGDVFADRARPGGRRHLLVSRLRYRKDELWRGTPTATSRRPCPTSAWSAGARALLLLAWLAGRAARGRALPAPPRAAPPARHAAGDWTRSEPRCWARPVVVVFGSAVERSTGPGSSPGPRVALAAAGFVAGRGPFAASARGRRSGAGRAAEPVAPPRAAAGARATWDGRWRPAAWCWRRIMVCLGDLAAGGLRPRRRIRHSSWPTSADFTDALVQDPGRGATPTRSRPDPLLWREPRSSTAGRPGRRRRAGRSSDAVLRFPGDPQTWHRLAAFQLGHARPSRRRRSRRSRGALYLDPFYACSPGSCFLGGAQARTRARGGPGGAQARREPQAKANAQARARAQRR